MKWTLLCVIFLLTQDPAEARLVKPSRRDSKAACTPRELKRKDCKLTAKKLKVGLFQDKWRFDDGKWLANQNLPVVGDGVQWQKVTLRQLGTRYVVEMWVWSEPQGETKVQDLNWIVMEVGNFSKAVGVQQVVQRRRLLPPRQVASTSKGQARYQLDPLEPHGLVLSQGKILWRAGRDKGEF